MRGPVIDKLIWIRDGNQRLSFAIRNLYYSIVMKQSNTLYLSQIFKALANEQRLKIFMQICSWCSSMLKNKKGVFACCGPEIEGAFTLACDCIDLSPSTISHHFKELQNAGLITCTRTGQVFNCKVNREALEAVKSFLA